MNKAQLEKKISEMETEMGLLADRMIEAESRKPPKVLYQTDPKLIEQNRKLEQQMRTCASQKKKLEKKVLMLQHEVQRLTDRLREISTLGNS